MGELFELVDRILSERDDYNIVKGTVARKVQGTRNQDIGQQNISLEFTLVGSEECFEFFGPCEMHEGQMVEVYTPKKCDPRCNPPVMLVRVYTGDKPEDYIQQIFGTGIG